MTEALTTPWILSRTFGKLRGTILYNLDQFGKPCHIWSNFTTEVVTEVEELPTGAHDRPTRPVVIARSSASRSLSGLQQFRQSVVESIDFFGANILSLERCKRFANLQTL